MGLWNNLRVAARTWRRTPTLAAVVALTLALGIGATTTAFTLAYSVLLRPFPFPDSERLVWITTYNTRSDDGSALVLNSNWMAAFAHWHQRLPRSPSFEQMAAWNAATRPDVYTVTGVGTPERVNGLRVTQQLFPMLGGQAALGSLFRAGDDRNDAAKTVVLSHGYWQRRFAGRSDIVGQSMMVENELHTVIGVVSETFPLAGSIFAGAPIDVYLPLAIDPNEDIGAYMAVLGRLRPGATIAQAEAELATEQRAFAVGRWQSMATLSQRVAPLPELITRDARTPVWLLFGGVGCVLLLVCANLGNLLLVRASGRRREMQVRAALGATARQVWRQTLSESAVLAAVGGAAGVALAAVLTNAVRNSTWLSLVRVGDLQLDAPALLLAAGLCVITTLAFGSVPLLHLRRDVMETLRQQGASTPDRRATRVQRVALTVQVAFALILTGTGALLLRSLVALLDVDPGFSTRGVIAMRIDPAGRLPPAARAPFFGRVLEQVSAVPGVQSAALSINLPMDRNIGLAAVPAGQTYDAARDDAFGRIVSPGYFRTAGIKIEEGRDFDARDRREAPQVIAINQTFARRLRAAGTAPLGSRFAVLGAERVVVAVIGDVKHQSLERDTGQEVYLPHSQAHPRFQAYDLVVRADDAMTLVPALREAIWRIDRNQAIGSPIELRQLIDRTLRPRRLLTWLVGGFAVTALLIAALGVYGVAAYRVTQRAREVAIRIALGAPRWRVASTVLTDTLAYVSIGVLVGVPLTLTAGAAVRTYLFGVAPRDVVTIATACAVVLAAGFAAACIPARRAPRIDPIATLRVE
jgi:putative ABC transport system permease protein